MPNIKELLPEEYPAWTSLDADTQEYLREEAAKIKMYLQRARRAEKDAQDYLVSLELSNDDLNGMWCLLESYERAALKRRSQ